MASTINQQFKITKFAKDLGMKSKDLVEGFTGDRETADAAGLDGQGDLVEDAGLSRVTGHRFGKADADVDDVVDSQLFHGAATDDAGGVVVLGLGGGGDDFVVPLGPFFVGDLEAAGQGDVGVGTFFRLHDDEGVDEAAGDDRVSGTGRYVGETVDLNDDFSVVGFDRLADGECIARHVLVVKGDVALAVRGCALDESDGQFREFIVEELLTFDFHDADEGVIDGQLVDAGALVAGVDEDVEADFGERAGETAGLRPEGMGDAAEGQVIGFEPVLQDQFLGAEHGAEMAADEAVDGTGFDISFRATLFVPGAETGT